MKVVILAGGLGTRLSEETSLVPKPMVNIGGKPMLMHIIDYFMNQGFNEFIICAGYKSSIIKQYFLNYLYNNSDITIDIATEKVKILKKPNNKFTVSIIDTGIDAQTAFRLKSVEKYIDDDFIFTYGDGLSDVNLSELINAHKLNNTTVTLTAVQVKNKFGLLEINNSNLITSFKEKAFDDNGGWINGGFMIVKKDVFKYLSNDDNESFEFNVLPKIAKDKQLSAHKHHGFWKCMDTLKDKNEFEKLLDNGEAPWNILK